MDTKGQVGCAVTFGGIKLAWYYKTRLKCKSCARVKIVLKTDWMVKNLLCLKGFSKVRKC